MKQVSHNGQHACSRATTPLACLPLHSGCHHHDRTEIRSLVHFWLSGLLSDALESVINLVASSLALVALWYASRPPDAEHTYGHEKIAYFSSGLEGMLILIAAITICWQAIQHLLVPHELVHLDLGLLCSIVASVVNFLAAYFLLREGKRHRSIVLEADGHHLMTDVYTSLAVISALTLVWLTGWVWLDAIVAILVALHILTTGLLLIRRSFDGSWIEPGLHLNSAHSENTFSSSSRKG